MQTCGFYDESGEFTIQCNCLIKAELQEELLVCILRILWLTLGVRDGTKKEIQSW
ncbi:hypothetical protein SAMN04488130_11222 [Flavobacterium urumqiense]|uniref:Uncharacterized protein n=1 Tax=Flavobacterium urumqiense TaxID=935224 RepID=A0A1H5ZW12_9FLAO|nr:hypothetical protein SAMN04488130_11222 [Flavobacterium urumqiense]